MTQELLKTIIETVLIPLMIAITGFVCKWLSAKSSEIAEKTKNENINKYVWQLDDTIIKCVTATNQTFVDALKKGNAFTEENQKEALTKCFNAVVAQLTEDAKIYLEMAYADLNKYIEDAIEAQVKEQKNANVQ